MNMLLPFLEGTHNLRSISFQVSIGNEIEIDTLSKLLRRFDNLTEFKCNGDSTHGFTKSDVEPLIPALAGHSDLRKLDLSYNTVAAKGMRALSALLKSPKCSLTDLTLYQALLDDEAAIVLSSALAENNTLMSRNIGFNCNI
ncbi:hypothetical protein ACHAWF_013907 [Thalassiosira exigua]